MAYDAVTESFRLIESGELTAMRSLSRRRRHAAMALDVSDDVAVTMFARRSVGCMVEDTHVFSRQDGQWTILGGGGGPLDDDALEDRPTELPARLRSAPGADARVLALDGAGAIADNHHRSWRSSRARRINYAIVRVNASVDRLIADGREIQVPWHGRCLVAWSGGPAQKLSIFGTDRRPMGQVTLSTSP